MILQHLYDICNIKTSPQHKTSHQSQSSSFFAGCIFICRARIISARLEAVSLGALLLSEPSGVALPLPLALVPKLTALSLGAGGGAGFLPLTTGRLDGNGGGALPFAPGSGDGVLSLEPLIWRGGVGIGFVRVGSDGAGGAGGGRTMTVGGGAGGVYFSRYETGAQPSCPVVSRFT